MAAETDPRSDRDDDSLMTEDTTAEEQANLQNDDDLPPTAPNAPTVKKLKKSQSADVIELEKLKVLQQMSSIFKAGRSKPIASDSDSSFGAQVAEELRAIKNVVLKTRVKRKIMNDLYEAQENDASTSCHMTPMYPGTSSAHMSNSQPAPPPTYTTPQEPRHHMPLPIANVQLLPNQYQLQNSETCSFMRMLEEE